MVNSDCPVDALEMHFLMPKYWSGNIIEETPDHLPEDLGMVHKNELTAAPYKSVVNQRTEKIV